MTTTTTEQDAGPFNRDQWDRPLIPDPDTGELIPYTRTSAFASLLDPPYLVDWHLTWGATAALADQSRAFKLIAGVGEVEYTIGDLAHEAGMNEKRDRGAARHALVQRALTGGDLDHLTNAQRKELDRVADTVRGLGTLTGIETPLVCDQWKCAGSADYIGTTPDGQPFVADLKTGARSQPHSWAIQTVTYARSRVWVNRERGAWVAEDMPRLYIVHAPQETGVVAVVELDPVAAVALAERAYQVAEARRGWRAVKPVMSRTEAAA